MVLRAITLTFFRCSGHHIILCQPVGFANGDRLAIHRAQHTAHECTVNIFVLLGKHGTCGTIESHSSSICIQQGGLANRRNHAIEWHNVAGSRYPQRQVRITEVFKIRNREHCFMRYLRLTSVSGIIHNQGTSVLLLLDDSSHLRIGITRRRGLSGISVPHHLLYQIVRIKRSHIISHFIRILHVEVVVTVVTHEHQGVLPGTCIFVLHIVDGLINHNLGFFGCSHRESSHGNILQLRFRISAFSFADDTQPTIAYITVYLTE